MASVDRPRLIFHGAVVLLVGLLCGLPTVVEDINGSERYWHTAHEALIMMGIWILAASSVLPALVSNDARCWVSCGRSSRWAMAS